MFSHLSSSLQGLSTIRAFKVQQRFQEMFDEYQDLHSGPNNSHTAMFKRKKKVLSVFFIECFSLSLLLHLPQRFFILSLPPFFFFKSHLLCFQTEAWFLFLTTSRWFAVRLDGICSIFVTITAFGCLYLRDGTAASRPLSAHTLQRDDKIRLLDVSEMEPGAVGLALSYAITLTGMFQWGVRQSAEIENMVRTFTSTRYFHY